MKRRVASEVRKRCSSSNAVAPDGMSETGTAALKHALTRATYSWHGPCVMTLIRAWLYCGGTHNAVRAHDCDHLSLLRESQTAFRYGREERSRSIIDPLLEFIPVPSLPGERFDKQ